MKYEPKSEAPGLLLQSLRNDIDQLANSQELLLALRVRWQNTGTAAL